MHKYLLDDYNKTCEYALVKGVHPATKTETESII